MSAFFKSRSSQLSILVISFLVVFVPYFVNIPALDWLTTKLMIIAAVTNAFTIVIAVYSQWRRSGRFIREKRKGWVYHIYLLLLMVFMIFNGVVFGQHVGGYEWLLKAVVTPLSSVIYGILAFYMASAGARAFRARSPHAALLLIAGLIVLLYQAPLTGSFVPGIEPAATYLTDTFGMSVSRMFSISVCIGAIVLGVRMLTGREVAFLGFGEE
ncbi:MAG: hypothetical protein HWN71_08935 [Desulfobacterales bacterium]|nr:hypothetical protein [Desulfobacterales bacterium]